VTATPIPHRLYIHDDLTDLVRATGQSSAVALADSLFAAIRRESHTIVLTEAEQIAGLLARGDHPPFARAIGIGRAGERVAHVVHARTGWFPSIARVDVAREEDGQGGYVLAAPVPLARQLADLPAAGRLAIVDDTVFSGLTLGSVLQALPEGAQGRTHAFCLRAVVDSLGPLVRICPVTAGFTASGRLLDDVSFINASGLVRRGAIRRVGASPLAFFERPEWMRAWFPRGAEEVTRLCRQLATLLEQTAAPSLARAPAV
jgi:hypothetical protein